MNIKHNKIKVIQSGIELFWKKGYNSVGINEICEVTGMTKGAFYHQFKGKENFLNETILAYGKINSDQIKKFFKKNNKITGYEKLLNFYSYLFLRQPEINFIGCYLNNIMLEVGIINKRIGKVASNVYENFINDIEPIVIEAQENKEIISTINSRKITELLQSSFYGALTRAQSSKNNKQGINLIQILLNTLRPDFPKNQIS